MLQPLGSRTFRDVNQTVEDRLDLDECSEAGQVAHLAV